VAITRVVLIIEYDGRRYYGSQLQVGIATIQGEIERAIEKLTCRRCRVGIASRTDAGVHAYGQVVSFRTDSPLPEQTFVMGMNYHLPMDIAVKAAYRVADSFDVRRDAISRQYNYRILNSSTRSPLWKDYAYLVVGHLNIAVMNEACKSIIGRHDFASFASRVGAEKKCTLRNVYRAEMERRGCTFVFNMTADSFLPHQVRNTVGLLIEVGLGRVNIGEFCDIMKAKTPGLARPAVPAHGLYLMKVDYPFSFGEERLNENL
jgi:tRNA pseudouridine38-40 synthase